VDNRDVLWKKKVEMTRDDDEVVIDDIGICWVDLIYLHYMRALLKKE
jgi:hypothetical protein